MVKSYLGKSFSLNFRHPFDSRESLKFSWEISWYLPARTAIVIKPNRFYHNYVQKDHGFRENLVSVIVSTFLIFMFVDQLLPS